VSLESPASGETHPKITPGIGGQVETKGDVMAIIKGSIEADVPLEFADLEWSKFVIESFYRNYSRGFADVEPLIDEQDMDAGEVKFETEGDRLVRVTVEVDYVPRSTATAAEEIARAEGALQRDLERYRVFLLERCEQESCRPK
jgi:hypothetical protein